MFSTIPEGWHTEASLKDASCLHVQKDIIARILDSTRSRVGGGGGEEVLPRSYPCNLSHIPEVTIWPTIFVLQKKRKTPIYPANLGKTKASRRLSLRRRPAIASRPPTVRLPFQTRRPRPPSAVAQPPPPQRRGLLARGRRPRRAWRVGEVRPRLPPLNDQSLKWT